MRPEWCLICLWMCVSCVSCRTAKPVKEDGALVERADSARVKRFVADTFPTTPDLVVSTRRIDLRASGSAELLVTLECVGHVPCESLPKVEGAPRGVTMAFMLYQVPELGAPELLWSKPRLTAPRAIIEPVEVDGAWPRELLLHVPREPRAVRWITQVISVRGDVSHELEHEQVSVLDVEDVDGDGRDELIVRDMPHVSTIINGNDFYSPVRRTRVYVNVGTQWELIDVVLGKRQVERMPAVSVARLYRSAPEHVHVFDSVRLMALYEELNACGPLSLYADGPKLFRRGPDDYDLNMVAYHSEYIQARALHDRWRASLDMLDVLELLRRAAPSEEVATWALARIELARSPEEIIALWYVHHAAMQKETRRVFYEARMSDVLGVVYEELGAQGFARENFARVHAQDPSLTRLNRAWFSYWAMRSLGRVDGEQITAWLEPIMALAWRDVNVLGALVSHVHLAPWVVRILAGRGASWDDESIKRVVPVLAGVTPGALRKDYGHYMAHDEERLRLVAILERELKQPQSLDNLTQILQVRMILGREGVTLTQIMRAGMAWLNQSSERADSAQLDVFESVLCGHIHELPRAVSYGLVDQLSRHGGLGTFCDFRPRREIKDAAEREAWSDRMLDLLEWFDVFAATAMFEGPIDSSPYVKALTKPQRVRFDALLERERTRARTQLPTYFDRASGVLKRQRELFAALRLIRQDAALDGLMDEALDTDAYWTESVCVMVYSALLNPFRQAKPASLTDPTVARFRARCEAKVPWEIKWPQ